MTRVYVDAALSSKLSSAADLVEVCDDAGKVLGFFYQAAPAPTREWRSPLSDEEIQRRLQEPRVGRPLADILKDLGAV